MANIGYIQVTRKCNQRCRFCSNPENDNVLSFDDAVSAIDELKAKGFEGVIFTGGEPTIYEKLPDLIKYAISVGIHPRLISNGQILADRDYFKNLIHAGLNHFHFSLHSYKEEIQNALTCNDCSFENMMKTLEFCRDVDCTVNLNTVINKYNADHLDKTVEWLVARFPFIHHYVWNNLDPFMNRVEQNRDVIPKFQDFEISLFKAAAFLSKRGYTFRIERVPLCYMAEFSEFSTETRKIVKNEQRDVYFLDKRKKISQKTFFYEKAPQCSSCTLNSICAGIYGGENFFPYAHIYPVFIRPESIIKKIQD